ncbi:SNF2 family N-terminal domain-containing protein [Cercophora newfieldiana]|uniref:DNA helicase n=1 Tax=Cercophora newfieldiana TaxID=92897 RepID=A0AA39YAB0_9PEZI|nr:SNF2 family N-terminal domain-containing protein [Cercophora newfieldiana]
MTEIASPSSPSPTHADPPTTNGNNGLYNTHAVKSAVADDAFSSKPCIPTNHDADPPLSPKIERRQSSARRASTSLPNGINGINGHARDSAPTEDGPPAKRRRRDTTPDASSRRPKPESPPWKKVEAEGPSSFTAQDGRRKSGRINTVPIEHQRGDKRITRRALHGQQASPPKGRIASANGHNTPTHTTPSASNASRRLSSSSKQMPPPKASATRSSTQKPSQQDTKSATRSRRRSASPRRPTTPTRPAVGTRRSTRHAQEINEDGNSASAGAMRTTPRIKFRSRPPLAVIPLVHRDQANIRRKLGPTFEEYFERAADIPVEDGGLLTTDDGPQYTEEMARHDAQVILRVEKEVEPGGILSRERCSVFEPEPEEEPPRQWAHMDHLTRAMGNFRRLMLQEQQRHRAAAKRLALACEAEWRRRNPQPKTAEEIELEQLERSKTRWRQVNKAIVGTWENVKAEINRRRLAEWEAEEQRRVKAALNQAVNLSEQKLQARQAQIDTEDLTEDLDEDELDSDLDDEGSEDGSGDGSENNPDEDESNMSSSDDDDDKSSVLSDEGLTQEQLREKYANLPDLGTPGSAKKTQENGTKSEDADSILDDDTSDESVDMDDDLGSTEDESESGEDDGSGSDGDAEESDDEPAGLLGLFFKKSELKQLKAEAEPSVGTVEDVEMQDAEMPELGERGSPTDKDSAIGLQGGRLTASCTLEEPPLDGTSDIKGPTPDTAGDPGASCTTLPASLADGVALPPVAPTAPDPEVPGQDSDVAMVDSSHTTEHPEDGHETPQIEISEAQPNGQHPSPETDAITNLQSRSRSQSPKVFDESKPSEVETPTTGSLLNVPKTDSRSTSPQPTVPKTEIPFLLRGTLREYQHLGLDWLASLYANHTNGILADEMGLGKTIQTIALLAHLACNHGVWGPHLVIVPTSVMLNWEMEFKKWCPGFKILTYYGNQDERKRKRQGWTNDDVWNVCITSYQMVLQDQQVFRRRRWHYMILDEAHNIKNFKSQRWQTLLGFNTHSRLLLTGTPLQNNLTELWSLLYFLAPPENGEGGFVDLSEFHNWFSRPESQILENGREQLDDEARAIISKLHKVLRPYLLRRLKADVEKQMPAKYEHVEFCRLSKRQRELYDGFLSRADTRQTLASGNYMSIINCLMQLRKVCNHPDLFVDRPIMTSLRMQRSVPGDFEPKEALIRRTLLAEKPMTNVSLSFLNMVPTLHEGLSAIHTDRIVQLSSNRTLLDLREAQKARANNAYTALDAATVKSNIVFLESAARWGRFEELQHCVYLNILRRQQRPIYGKRLVDLLTLRTECRPFKQKPKVPAKIMSWFEEDSFLLRSAILTLNQRAASMETTITKFACVTPAVVTNDVSRHLLGEKGVEAFQELDLKLSAPVKYAPYMPKEPPPDPWHEARMRLSIQFPDKRLLQYDCGKLQALDKLLRKLQAGGHRALIFTQMTKVLDILELFLNIHGHKYLRLDGATKVEQRQILTDRFNVDTRILCFILSTRSGGLGINLTGADTVIFYDQDWNPAMDKQCQDRCHRIGQTRDVHIYRLVSEHTIEANILRKANQKQMLDDVVIQEGDFTTDYFNKLSVRDVIGINGEVSANENDVVANLAMDRVLGGVESTAPRNVSRVLEQAEDKEDVAAARVAEKEIQQDDADFLEQQPAGSGPGSGQGTPREGTEPPLSGKPGQSGLGLFAQSAEDIPEAGVEPEYNAFGEKMRNIDDFMLAFMAKALEGTPLDLPKDKKRSKRRGRDTRKR